MSMIRLSVQPPRVADEANGSAWTIPVCAAAQGKPVGCAELADRMVSLDVRSAQVSCSAWLDLNPGLAGYYEQDVTPEWLERAAREFATLSEAARFGILRAVWAGLHRGDLRATPVLNLLPSFDNETDLMVEVLEVHVLNLFRFLAIREPTESAFRRYAGERLRHLKRFLDDGLGPPDEVWSSELDFARTMAVFGVGYLAQDPRVVASLRSAVMAWAASPAALDPDIGPVAFRAAAARADPSLFEALMARAADGPTLPNDRWRFKLCSASRNRRFSAASSTG